MKIQELIAQARLDEALDALKASHPAEAAILLREYGDARRSHSLNLIGFEEWNRIQSRISFAALNLASVPVQSQPQPPQPNPEPLVPNPASRPLKIFLSYAHKDEELKDELAMFLAPLRRLEKIAVWHDREIIAGQEWDEEIKQELASADIILLLVSPAFLASDYIWKNEIGKSMERHQAGSAKVVPVFLKPSMWQEMPFAKIQGLPRNAKPVTQHDDRDTAFLEVAQGIRRVVEAF